MEKEINIFVNSKKKRKLHEIRLYLENQLSPLCIYYISDLNKRDSNKKIYKDEAIYYSKHVVRIYFPFENKCIICSEVDSSKLPIIKNILEEEWKEKPIKFKYWDETIRQIMNGPKIVIIKNEMSSIILENGKTLTEILPLY